jgi:uroporphyrinogen decarboxylase
MRQAGRILPEYRAVRKKLSGFLELVKTPELAAEVTLQPVDILEVDAAIIFSDILVIPEAMGLPYQMVEKKGPYFPETIQSPEQVDRLKIADPESDLHYVLEAIRLVKKELDGRVPLIGFAGAPWTVFAYMIEGSGSKTFSRARRKLYQEPELSHALLDKITFSTIAYLKAQIKAGADLVQIFDSWAGILPKSHYETYSLPYIRRICEAIDDVPVTVFAKGAYFSLAELADLPCQTVGLDWQMDIGTARKLAGADKTLQGNLDPCVLYASTQEITSQTREMMAKFGKQRYIANLGHGVYPDTKVDAVRSFIDAVKNFSSQ